MLSRVVPAEMPLSTLPEATIPGDRRPQPMPLRRGRRGAVTTAQERAIVERYDAGESTRQLANAFGVAQAAICGVLYDAGHALRDGGQRRLTGGQEQQLANRCAAGRTQRQLAAELGVSAGTVRNVLRRQATPTRPPGSGHLLTVEQERDVAARLSSCTGGSWWSPFSASSLSPQRGSRSRQDAWAEQRDEQVFVIAGWGDAVLAEEPW
jgi:transcriptional regulator with XRE-family HTH domain